MKTSRKSGFTLVELLVVIGIIAVLIAMLLPALNRARQQAISIQCMSNMKQVGMGALMYLNDSKGWYPPSNAANPSGSAGVSVTNGKFLEYQPTPNESDRFRVSVRMAQYAGYKFRPWEGSGDTAYRTPRTPVFFCPADDQVVGGVFYNDNNLLIHGSTPTNAGNNDGKIRYWWCANPWYNCPINDGVMATTYGSNVDLAAAAYWAHMDQNPTQDPAGPAWFDPSRACIPGIDYLRSTKDKHITEVAIMVDRSQQRNGIVLPNGNPAGQGVAFMMHGSAGPNSKKGWKNELFGDGHCESRRFEQMRQHWAPANPEFW